MSKCSKDLTKECLPEQSCGSCPDKEYSTNAIHPPINDDDEVYPCADCGKLRSKNQGGTIFAVCDRCWDKHYRKQEAVK
jgi:hypothetical protein